MLYAPFLFSKYAPFCLLTWSYKIYMHYNFLPHWSVPCFSYLIPPLKIGFNFIAIFTLEINVKAGVSCLGMRAPMYLFMNFVIVSILVVLFDSSIFLFLRVSPEDFKIPRSRVLARCGIPEAPARLIEQGLVRGGFVGAGRNMKTIIQLVMAKILWNDFIPWWNEYSPACEKQQPYSESVALYATSILFWLLFIPMIHLLLNTAVYGIASKKTDCSAPSVAIKQECIMSCTHASNLVEGPPTGTVY